MILYFYGPSGYAPCTKAESSWGTTSTSSDGNIVLPLTNTFTRYSVTWTVGTGSATTKHVLWRLFGGDAKTAYIYAPKLEYGQSATEWCAADEDAVQASVNTNDFSWKFSPSEGMFMWNGA